MEDSNKMIRNDAGSRIPYDVILFVIAPYLLPNSETCTKNLTDNCHHIAFLDREIYQNIKRYLPSKCSSNSVIFNEKILCGNHDDSISVKILQNFKSTYEKNKLNYRSMLLSGYVHLDNGNSSNEKQHFFYHTDKIDDDIINLFNEGTLHQKIKDVLKGTNINIINECCGGYGISYIIKG